ncbi:related to C2H2 zinc finger protein [Melanopsichium pennsylvanicum]|uniref:Related to C2H2 zinc finger protein n=2 Tax=Melanopsichium pennsylvanicum TaxID=63383 RepID=A0AAJ4XU04_9BASI|nr:related to C2H2 zinc finger protein [Melanopsichium pennsylvanicum 4]SNX87338.1 related to C2H2 zinc finger protein [Melanopsichium pennsylvanicum]
MVRKESSSSEMRYTCDQPGCTKSYSRPDHLLRHKLNHDQARILCCNQCDRTFVRQDLLVRHLERHALRGKTLGRWSNRHKDGNEDEGDDADGPSSQNKAAGSSNKRRRSAVASKSRRQGSNTTSANQVHDSEDEKDDDDDFDDDGDDFQRDSRASTQPHYQTHESRLPHHQSSFANTQHDAPASWEPFPAGPTGSQPPPPSASYSNPGAWPSNTPMSPPTSRLTNSYAAPSSPYRSASVASASDARFLPADFTSASYRSDSVWGDASSHPGLRPGPVASADPAAAASQDNAPFRWMPGDPITNEPSAGSYAPPPSASYMTAWHEAQDTTRQDVAMPLIDLETTAAATSTARLPSALPLPNQDIFPFAPPIMDHTADYGWLFDGVDPFGGSNWGGSVGRAPTAGSNPRGPQSQTSGFSPSSSDGLGGFLGNMHGSQNGTAAGPGAGDASSFGRGMSSDGVLLSGSEVETPNALEDLAYFATLQADIPSRITYHLDPVARHRLLIFLQSVSELPNSPLFTPSALRCYIYLFFVKFNRLYPLIHEPTFAASTTDPMLLSAIVVIGAHFAGLPAHELAVRIAQKIWGAVVSLEDFRPARATLPMLQALVLTESFGKMMSTRPQHEMAHLFHNFIITLARRNAVFNASTPSQMHFDDSEESWRSWAREEEKKRIALFEFMLDAQHATIFRHIPSLSAFQIQLHLPCSDEEWTKATPEAWYRHRKRTGYKPPGPFIPALKACLSPAKTPQELDAFPRFVLLHGLMSIAYDLQWKQNVLLGAEASPGGSKGGDNGIGNWKDRLSAAYSSLQARMDIAYIKADEESSTRLIHRATPSLVTAAQIALFADIIDIQIYAGLPSVLGRFIDRATFNASRRSVKEWARTSDGRTAVWYAVNFLRISLLSTGTESYGTIQTCRSGASVANVDDGRDNAPTYPDLRDREDSSGIIGSLAARKASDRETGLDEVLHHRWCQYICALVIWAYGHALTIPRVGAPVEGGTTAPVGGSSAAGVLPTPDSAHRNGGSALSSSLTNSPGALQGQISAERTQIVGDTAAGDPVSSRNTHAIALKPEGIDFLERMSTKTADDLAYVECKCYTRALLEMVEREVRASRWELGREASGVLRKLISNHSLPVWDRSGESVASARRNDLSSLTIQQQSRPSVVKEDPDIRASSAQRMPSTGSTSAIGQSPSIVGISPLASTAAGSGALPKRSSMQGPSAAKSAAAPAASSQHVGLGSSPQAIA